jgi:hypothetical protein
MDKEVSEFLAFYKERAEDEYIAALEFFFIFFAQKVRIFVELNHGNEQLQTFYGQFCILMDNFSKSLFRYLNYANNYFYMKVPRQISSFFKTVYMLRSVLKV